jgi:hypothetical protein
LPGFGGAWQRVHVHDSRKLGESGFQPRAVAIACVLLKREKAGFSILHFSKPPTVEKWRMESDFYYFKIIPHHPKS